MKNRLVFTRNVDGLGRLSQVTEDPGGLGYNTYYLYDGQDNLTGVCQNGTWSGTTCQGGMGRSFTYSSLSRLISATNPESGTITYGVYDPNGNLTSKTDARGVNTALTYDPLNRLKTKSYTDGTPGVTYNYYLAGGGDTTGTLNSVASTATTTTYTHDKFGRVTGSTQTTGGTAYPFSYVSSLSDQMKSITYPSGRKVSYGYNTADRPVTVTGLASGVTSNYTASGQNIAYTAAGGFTSLPLGNGLTEGYTWNDRLQETSITAGSLALNFYFCDSGQAACTNNNGNLWREKIKNAIFTTGVVQEYRYDGLNRLAIATESPAGSITASTTCTSGTGAWCRNFQYTASTSNGYGNMYTSQNFGLSLNTFTPQAASNFNLKNQLIIQGSGYDAGGNQTVIGAYGNGYDAENRQKTSVIGGVTTTYTYDGDGRRVQKQTGSTTTTYVYDAGGQLAAEYLNTTPPAAPCATCYLTADHLGSTRMLTDASGVPKSLHDYLPFGEEIQAGVNGRSSAYYPANPLAINDGVTEKFTGKERDAETGNDYFGARYLSSAQGRFTSPDPSRLSAFIESPQTWNMYVYAYNNPLQFVDENGSWPTQIHNKIIDAAFPNLTTAQRQILKDVSAHQDAILTDGNIMGGQAGALSFQHAMRDSGQSVAEAESDYNYFVSLNEDEATRIQIGFWAAGNQGFSNNALAEFALALHAILDSTSPSHAGFQVWELSHLREHKKAEASITPQQLNAAVSAAQNAFNTTFHPTFNFVFGQPGQQQSAPNKPKKPKQPDVTSKICYTLPDGSKVCQ